MKVVGYDDLAGADLTIDAVYEGGSLGNTADDPISKLLRGAGNQGGFRAAGRGDNKKFVILYSSGEDKDWPDRLDLNTGQFVYYGDNKEPGQELHAAAGNKILRHVFGLLHAIPPARSTIPPFFIFKKYPTAKSNRSVQFKGLGVPGFPGLPATADLVAVWKSSRRQRFQNYEATFTVLNVPVIERAWIADLRAGQPLSATAPRAWVDWVKGGRYRPLAAESTTVIRTLAEQLPNTPVAKAILCTVWKHFKDTPLAFEAFAARIFQMQDPRVVVDEITRGSVDGGRDAIGRYLMGLPEDPVYAEFSLEAKCYAPPIDGKTANTVGVKEVARLISRIRHRQFGVLVTTSVIARQAYEEVRGDRHPVIFFSGKDIADILMKSGFNTPQLVENLLQGEFALGGEI